MTQEKFALWLTLGRLMTFSFGKQELTIDIWKQVKEMEMKREERMKEYYK